MVKFLTPFGTDDFRSCNRSAFRPQMGYQAVLVVAATPGVVTRTGDPITSSVHWFGSSMRFGPLVAGASRHWRTERERERAHVNGQTIQHHLVGGFKHNKWDDII